MAIRWPQFSQEPSSHPWWGLASMDAAGPVAPGSPASHFPLEGWPAMPTVEYLTKLILLGLLLLALPYLVGRLLLNPSDVLSASAERAMHGPIQ